MLNCAMPRANLADGAEGVGEAFGKRTTISVTWYYLFLRSIYKLGLHPSQLRDADKLCSPCWEEAQPEAAFIRAYKISLLMAGGQN